MTEASNEGLAARLARLAPYTLLAAVAVAGYGRTLDVPWYLDDFASIVANPVVRDLRRAAGEAFTPRGLTTLSFALDWARGALLPAPFHLTNLVIHVIAGWLAYVVLRRVLSGRVAPALFAALIFVAHPLQTQAVTYVVQRSASLAGALCLGAIALFLRADAARAAGAPRVAPKVAVPYLMALALGALALFAKQSAAALPLLLAALVPFAPPSGRREGGPAWRRMVAILPFLVAPAVVGLRSLGTSGGGAALPAPVDADVVGSAATVTRLGYLSTEMEVIWRYLRLLVWPRGQVFDMGLSVATDPWRPVAIAAGLGLVALVGVSLRARRTVPMLAFAVLWMLAALSVESSLIPLDPYFEHRVYLGVLGFSALVADLVGRVPRVRLRAGLAVCGVAALLALTVRRNEEWRDPVALFRADLAGGSMSYRSAMGLADAMWARNDPDQANEAYRTLVARGERRCATSACGGVYLQNLGVSSERLGDLGAARRFYEAASRAAPSYAPAHFGLGVVAYREGRLSEALSEFARVVQLSPGDVVALWNYCSVALELGDPSPARTNLERIRSAEPRLATELEAELASRGGR